MIELNNLTKSYTTGKITTTVLKGINLFIAKGEFVSIMGPSGSGKSTLAAILGCLSQPTKGSYLLDGDDVTHLPSRQLAHFRNQKIGYIFQDFNLLEGLTALENVALPLVYAGVSTSVRRQRALDKLAKVGMADRHNFTPKQLSGGQKQRVAIARALINEPQLIFADEPTGALDAKNTTEVMDLLQHLNVAGHTIVQVTHAKEDAEFSKRIIYLVDGLVIRDEPVERFTIANTPENTADKAQVVSAKLWRVAAQARPAELDDLKAVRKLFRASADTRSMIEAARAIGQYNREDFNHMLLKLSRHPHWAVRAELIKACTPDTHSYAIGFFQRGISDESAWVRFLAISKLRHLPREFQLICDQEAILRCLQDSDERVRAATTAMVGLWRKPELVPMLRALAVEDRNVRVRANAMAELKPYLDDPVFGESIVEALAGNLKFPHHRIASTAAVLLYPYRPDAAFAALAEMATADTLAVRAAGAWGLGNIPDALRAAPLLVQRLLDEKDEMPMNQVVASLARLTKTGFSFAMQVEATLSPNHFAPLGNVAPVANAG